MKFGEVYINTKDGKYSTLNKIGDDIDDMLGSYMNDYEVETRKDTTESTENVR
jgi:hypothetical protein